jgi:YceI-like domain
MITHHERSEPEITTSNRSHPPPTGTWTIDPAASSVSFAWRTLWHWTSTRRLHGLGVIHLDELPPVGVVRFHQPSGLPVLTMALDPASLDTEAADFDAMGCGPDAVDVMRPWWWTLRSQSLEVLPAGTWRVMATLTARGHRRPGRAALRGRPPSPAATCWCCEDGSAGSTGLRHRQASLDLRPQDPTGTGCIRHTNETRIRPTGPCFPRRSPCIASPFPPTLSDLTRA